MKPVIGLSSYRESARWGAWEQPADLLPSEYARAVRKADAAVGRLLAAADTAFGAGNYSIIVTADHGGHGRDHGSDRLEDVTIPWIAWGRGG